MRPLVFITTLLLLLVACAAPQPGVRARLGAVEAVNADDGAGFARAFAPQPFVFPRDHGPHPEYQTEWWYYTGNLATAEGRHFGFQVTFFRRALAAQTDSRASAWATRNVYMAHLALSDVSSGAFYAYERLSRDGAGLAGATGEPFRVFLDDWSAEGHGPEGMTMHLRAAEGNIALDLTLTSSKPPVLQGDRGLSAKGPTSGNASYYYSLSRMAVEGTVQVDTQPYAVQGLAWMDHEWGTSALEGDAVGWDWFSMQLADGRDLMYAQIRTTKGVGYEFGAISQADGSVQILDVGAARLETLATWRSPRSNATYPARWRFVLPREGLSLELVPLLPDQELPVAVVYWEGAVQISGTQNGQALQGYGYVELTGYTKNER